MYEAVQRLYWVDQSAVWNGPDLLGVLVHFESMLGKEYGTTGSWCAASAIWSTGS